jgi:hypothetical protein
MTLVYNELGDISCRLLVVIHAAYEPYKQLTTLVKHGIIIMPGTREQKEKILS